MFASDNSNGSFRDHEHANKKKIQKLPFQAFVLGEITKLTRRKDLEETSGLKIIVKSLHPSYKEHILALNMEI